MTLTEAKLTERLRAVEDPQNDEDIVSLGLVQDVSIDDGTASISLAFNTPSAPTEVELGNEIRDAVDAAGLKPQLTGSVDEVQGFHCDVLPGVKNVIAVASGKGGVGKTTIAANLAAGLSELGARVGVLDADVHGPNAPSVLPTNEGPSVAPNGDILPPESGDVKVMSTEYLLPEGDDEPAALRGPMVHNVMRKFVEEVHWGHRDYLIVDLPPGTGDASIDLLQTLPVAGAVIVTTAQEMAVSDARKSMGLFERHDTAVLGVVENMSVFKCPGCEDDHRIFGRSGAVEELDAPLLARLPADPAFDSERSGGPVVRDDSSPLQSDLMAFVETTVDAVGKANRMRVAEHVASGGDTPSTAGHGQFE